MNNNGPDYINAAIERGLPVNPETTRIIFVKKRVVFVPAFKTEDDFTPHNPTTSWYNDYSSRWQAIKRWFGKLFNKHWGQYWVTFCDCPHCSPYKSIEIDTNMEMGYNSSIDVLAVYKPD